MGWQSPSHHPCHAISLWHSHETACLSLVIYGILNFVSGITILSLLFSFFLSIGSEHPKCYPRRESEGKKPIEISEYENRALSKVRNIACNGRVSSVHAI